VPKYINKFSYNFSTSCEASQIKDTRAVTPRIESQEPNFRDSSNHSGNSSDCSSICRTTTSTSTFWTSSPQ